MMYRYLVFSGEYYYPMGGWQDFALSLPDRDEAVEYAKREASRSKDRWSEVVDYQTGETIYDSMVPQVF